jgi:hypothetical protein
MRSPPSSLHKDATTSAPYHRSHNRSAAIVIPAYKNNLPHDPFSFTITIALFLHTPGGIVPNVTRHASAKQARLTASDPALDRVLVPDFAAIENNSLDLLGLIILPVHDINAPSINFPYLLTKEHQRHQRGQT